MERNKKRKIFVHNNNINLTNIQINTTKQKTEYEKRNKSRAKYVNNDRLRRKYA